LPARTQFTQRCQLFFYYSDYLDLCVLKPLEHILPHWELIWDDDRYRYEHEDQSLAEALEKLIIEISATVPPPKYHDHEDRLAEFMIGRMGWKIKKKNGRWIGSDYESILEQGSFKDIDQKELIMAAAGRIKAALDLNQMHFDDMHESHRKMLGAILAIILYHRSNDIIYPPTV